MWRIGKDIGKFMRKRNMHLVSNKAMKKVYNKFFVVLCDDTIFEYSMNEWNVRMYEEWIEVEKMDKSEMDSFAIQSISRVRFVNTEKKKSAEVTVLKPVPLTVA